MEFHPPTRYNHPYEFQETKGHARIWPYFSQGKKRTKAGN